VTGGGDILIVDDDADMTEVVELILQEAGYPTRIAANGRDALDAVETAMPSLILLDMLMPVMNGWQFAREFHARHGDAVPIVVASAAEHVRSRGDEIAANDVLPKPFEVSDLLRVIGRHVPAPVPPQPPAP
jgi:CheY-like chemotaxis protein